jgi:hypothetical protein
MAEHFFFAPLILQTPTGQDNLWHTISDEQNESHIKADLTNGGDADIVDVDATDSQTQLMKPLTASTGPSFRRNSMSSISSQESVEFFVAEDGRVRSSLTSEPTEIEPPARCGGRIASKLCDRHLLCGLAFWFFTLALTFGQGGYFNTCFFAPPFIVERWHSKALASAFLTFIGVCDFFGRIGTGWFADLRLISTTSQMGVSLLVIGLATIVAPFIRRTAMMIVYALLFGSLGGAYQGLVGTVLADVFGVERLPMAFGLSHLVLGCTMLPLPPIFGEFEWAPVFWTCAAAAAAAAVCRRMWA